MATLPPDHQRAIRKVGAALTAREDELAAAMVARIAAEVPAYRRAPPAVLDDVLVLSTATARALSRALVDAAPISRDDIPIARDHAALRMRQGIELEPFLHAYRAALFRYWDACSEEAGRLRITRAAGLALARFALDAIDAVTTQAAEAYLREDSRLRTRSGRAERDLVDRLIAGQPVDATRRHQAAPGLDPGGALLTVVGRVAASGDDDDAELPDIAQTARDLVAEIFMLGKARPLVVVRQGEIVLLAVGKPPLSRLYMAARRAREEHGIDLRLGASTTPAGFAGVPRAYSEAALSASHTTAQRPVVALGELSPLQLALVGTDAPTRKLIAAKGACLTRLSDDDRDTIRAFVRADMSVSATAADLVVHPNTVRYRLTRIAEITDFDPRTFAGLGDLHCMLELDAEG
jgi:hypothetical protein